MPVERVEGGWRWGTDGKVYAQRWKAERQGRAIEFAKHGEKKSRKPRARDRKRDTI